MHPFAAFWISWKYPLQAASRSIKRWAVDETSMAASFWWTVVGLMSWFLLLKTITNTIGRLRLRHEKIVMRWWQDEKKTHVHHVYQTGCLNFWVTWSWQLGVKMAPTSRWKVPSRSFLCRCHLERFDPTPLIWNELNFNLEIFQRSRNGEEVIWMTFPLHRKAFSTVLSGFLAIFHE